MHPIPEPPPVDVPSSSGRDPLAVALGNASLFGVGYLLLGRRGLAAACALISPTMLVALGVAEHSGWLQYVLVGWWVAVVLHGWSLAFRTAGSVKKARRQRLVAALVTVAVVAPLVLFRFDVNGRADDADAAHRTGDCGLVLSIVDGVGFWQRIGDAPVADGMLDSAEACRLVERARGQAENDREAAAATIARYEELPAAQWKGAHRYRADLLLDQADRDLWFGLAPATGSLRAGFERLAEVRDEFPERRDDVDAVLDDFRESLMDEEKGDGCAKVAITDWLGDQQDPTAELERAAEIVPQLAPTALVACADQLLANKDGPTARDRYRQLITEYPSSSLLPRAKRGVTLAIYAIQLADLRARLQTTGPSQRPGYCRNPVPYGAAKPYRGRGPHRALVYGQDSQRNSLPRGWRAADPANATLIICAGASRFGDVVQTCPYTGGLHIGPTYVSFHKRRIPVRVFEVRTGRMIANTAVQIGGTSCPEVIRYTSYGGFDPGPSSDYYVKSSTADIRDAYRSLINP
ncbi:hypothetical protein [Actinophytocola sp.]|uniref:hypothetical protein n=1 Tax=Actinophytocola sp. TaxID=1872138 RepID=UPI003D6C502B